MTENLYLLRYRPFFLSLLFFALVGLNLSAQSVFQLPQSSEVVPVYRKRNTPTSESFSMQARKLSIEKFSVEQTPEFITVMLVFNIPVDPHSLTEGSVSVNKMQLPENSTIKFNRTGTELHISIPVDEIEGRIDDDSQELQFLLKDIAAKDVIDKENQTKNELQFSIRYKFAE